MTWRDQIDSYVVKSYRVGERFHISKVYDEIEEDLARQYPKNKNIRPTIRDVLQDLAEEERIKMHGSRGTPEAGWYHRES